MKLNATAALRNSSSSFVILSGARSAQPKDLLSYMLPRSSERKQVLRLRCAPLRMLQFGVARSTEAAWAF